MLMVSKELIGVQIFDQLLQNFKFLENSRWGL